MDYHLAAVARRGDGRCELGGPDRMSALGQLRTYRRASELVRKVPLADIRWLLLDGGARLHTTRAAPNLGVTPLVDVITFESFDQIEILLQQFGEAGFVRIDHVVIELQFVLHD